MVALAPEIKRDNAEEMGFSSAALPVKFAPCNVERRGEAGGSSHTVQRTLKETFSVNNDDNGT